MYSDATQIECVEKLLFVTTKSLSKHNLISQLMNQANSEATVASICHVLIVTAKIYKLQNPKQDMS